MANPQRGEVEFAINGRTFTLALGVGAMCEIEAAVSTPAARVPFKAVAAGMVEGDVRYTCVFFWGALRRHHSEVSRADVDLLIDESGGYLEFLARFSPVITELLQFTRPDADDRRVLKEAGSPSPTGAPVTDGIGGRSISKRAKSA